MDEITATLMHAQPHTHTHMVQCTGGWEEVGEVQFYASRKRVRKYGEIRTWGNLRTSIVGGVGERRGKRCSGRYKDSK